MVVGAVSYSLLAFSQKRMAMLYSYSLNIVSMLLAAAGDAQPIEKLPPPTRAAVIMALLGLVILGLFVVVAILLGGHWVRRLGKHRGGPSVPPDVAPMRPDQTTSSDQHARQKFYRRNIEGGDTLATDETIADE